MKTTLALRNLWRSGGRLWVSLFGIVFATFLMGLQGSLLYSFNLAASRIVDAVDADIVIVGKGTPTFDYVSPIPERYAVLALGADGVVDAGRGIAGWAPIERPNGDRTLTFLVGVEESFRGRLPAVFDIAAEHGFADSVLVIDTTDARTLQFSQASRGVQIASRRGELVDRTHGFSSFLGSPYVFTDYVDARRYLKLEQTQVSFLMMRIAAGQDAAAVRDRLRERFTDVDVWTRAEFAAKSRGFWLVQTGAGGALSLAALLGFCIGLVVVAQTIYSITAENIEEYATLKAMGASNGDIRKVVLVQSLVCGLAGGAIGLLLVRPFAAVIRPVVTWIMVPVWIYLMVAGALIGLCVLASLIAARPAIAVDPGRVFRA
jgi:putative ABC transport system permease protein